jgi:hypothetical protein
MSLHPTYMAKEAFYDANPNSLNTCQQNLIDLVSYGHISSENTTPNIFLLEANQDTQGFKNIGPYLLTIQPVLSYFASKSTACDLNVLSHPSFEIVPSSKRLQQGKPQSATYPPCRSVDQQVPPVGENDPRNDKGVQNHFLQMLNYKAVIGFGYEVSRIAPYFAITDRNRENLHLVKSTDLGSAFHGVNTDAARKLLSSAILFTRTAIAQQAAIGGVHDLSPVANDFVSGWRSWLDCPRPCPRTIEVMSLARDDLVLTNIIRQQLRSATRGDQLNDFHNFLVDPEHYQRTKFSRPRYAAGSFINGGWAVEDANTPDKFYFVTGIPGGLRLQDTYFFNGKVDRFVVMTGSETAKACDAHKHTMPATRATTPIISKLLSQPSFASTRAETISPRYHAFCSSRAMQSARICGRLGSSFKPAASSSRS